MVIMQNINSIKTVNNFFDSLTNELVYSGYFVALSGPTYVFIASLLLGVEISIPLLLIAYITPLIVYSFNYYNELSYDTDGNPERVAYLSKKKKYYFFILIGYITILFILLILFGNRPLMYFMAVLAILGILYTVLFKSLTRKVPLLKNIFVSLVWASGGSFFILLFRSMELNWFFVLFFIYIFIQDIANVIFFDIKDCNSDKKRGLLTLPAMWGRKNTIIFLYILNIIGLIPIIIGVYYNIFPKFTLFILLIIIYKIYYLRKAEKADNASLRFLTYTLVEAEFILLPILIAIGIVITNYI